MTSKSLEKKTEREKALAEQRQRIMAMAPEKALEAVMDYPYPVTLVQSMAEEDIYLLVHSIGPDDALPLLGMASNEQWEYFLDMEIWSVDRLEPQRMTDWWSRLLKADPDRFTHWIVNQQSDPLEYYFFRNIELHVREYEEDPAEVGDGFFSEDQTHYIRLKPFADADEKNKVLQEKRDLFLNDLLKRISVYDFSVYQTLLLESSSAIPAETEEELLRLRNVRLAEKGFLPFEEAVGVYQPLRAEELLHKKRKQADIGGRHVDGYPLKIDPAELPENADLFTRTLAALQDEPMLHRLQSEFAGLCNQIIAADQVKVREKQILSRVVTKVSRYISIGLEKVEAQAPASDPYSAANLVRSYLLADIFRVGYGCALNLKWRAEKWRQASWFNRAGLSPTFWGEAWLGVLGGLLIKKPLFFDNYETGVLYREFATLAEVDRTDHVLRQIIATDELLSLMDVHVPELEADTFVSAQNLILTLWANHVLGMDTTSRTPSPLTLARFREFFAMLWEAGPAPRKVKDSMREMFLDWLSQISGIATYDIAERMGGTLEDLFGQIENELGEVESHKIDARFIQLFLLS